MNINLFSTLQILLSRPDLTNGQCFRRHCICEINTPDITTVSMCISYLTAVRIGLKTQFPSDYALNVLGYLHLIDIK